MATQPPPGYNPEASLLQGGTTPILPVQGGGSLPPDYNPSASLLQGGTGVIEPIRGGGEAHVKFAEDLKDVRKFEITNRPKNIVRASKVYALEIYGLQGHAHNLVLESDIAIRQRRLNQYVTKEKTVRLLTSMATLRTEDGQFTYTGYPKYGDCKPSLPINYFNVMARKVTIVDEKPHMIWLIPNIRGNKEVFETILDTLVDNGSLPGKEHLLIFTGSFYADTPNETSVFLFDEILKLKQKNPGQVFVLSPPTATLLRNGCFILENTYAMKSTLAKQQGKTKEVPTFFEPDVLVLPHEQIIIRSTDMPISSDSKVSVGRLLAKQVHSKSVYIKPEPGRKTEPVPFENYTTILSNPNQSETRSWPSKSKQTIRCPKDSDCQKFEAGFQISELGDAPFLNLLETKLYLFHITSDKIPYLTGPKDEEEQEQEEEIEVEEEEQEQEQEQEIEVEEVEEEPVRITKPVLPKGPFQESPQAKPSDQTVEVKLEGFSFALRMASKSVEVDWMNGVFSKDEAAFLNALQLSPKLLKTVFGEGYQWRIRKFLTSLTVSNCFKEAALLLKDECDDARRFLRKIGFELQKECLANATKQWGAVKEGKVEVVKNENEKELESESEFVESVEEIPISNGLRNLDLPAIVSRLKNLRLSKAKQVLPELNSISSRLNNLNIEELEAIKALDERLKRVLQKFNALMLEE